MRLFIDFMPGQSNMTETEFLQRSEETLTAIEAAVEQTSLDVEVERAGNVLTLELDNGAKIVVNSQAPMQQIWVAAKTGGQHFAWQDGAWRDTRDGTELFASLSRILSVVGDQAVVLRAS
jgi:CyaY protein